MEWAIGQAGCFGTGKAVPIIKTTNPPTTPPTISPILLVSEMFASVFGMEVDEVVTSEDFVVVVAETFPIGLIL